MPRPSIARRITLENLDQRNQRNALQRWAARIFAGCFRALVDTASTPLYYSKELRKGRFSYKVDTGPTGVCRILVYLPTKPPKDPEDYNKPLGCACHIPGGGWTICRPETEAALCRYLADELNTVIISPDYRKAPHHPFPHGLEQIYAVLEWVSKGGLNRLLEQHPKAQHTSIRINPHLLAISGGSAGSNLAAAVTLLAIERPIANAKIVALGLLYPAVDLALPFKEKVDQVDAAHALPHWMSRFFLHSYVPPPQDFTNPLISPSRAADEDLKQFPATVVLTAERDYLAPEADEFSGKLERNGVKVKNRRFENVGHAFDGIPNRDVVQRGHNERAKEEAWGMIRDCFKEHLVDNSHPPQARQENGEPAEKQIGHFE